MAQQPLQFAPAVVIKPIKHALLPHDHQDQRMGRILRGGMQLSNKCVEIRRAPSQESSMTAGNSSAR
jgi:hypothetical protein